MLRKITQAIGRYKLEEVHDYPRDVWEKIARDAKQKLDEFSEPIGYNPALRNPLKGRLGIRKRLGSEARQ